ncbi:MAG: efflux RND transporter permease subunit, partial [Proteobacteria bacterium]|nr:efflux RND transporter permease subunit [Pseudomonadota bacterium]MBU4128021.1 efflux RND transporter permease subunit [Pseudomonadota bacterium]
MDLDNHTPNIKKGPVAWMAGHSVAANLLMLVLLVGGIIMAYNIKQEVFPYFEMDMVNITVPYPGASPQEVEEGILLAIEEAVVGLEGVEEIRSTAREGSGTVTVEMIEGENLQKLAQDIRNEVDRITSFPEDIEEPMIAIVSRKRYVVSLALYGDQSELVLREYADYIRDRLLQEPDITQVEVVSARNHEIDVEIPQNTLRAYSLTLDDVAQRIRRASVELPGGAIRTPSGDILVRMKERRDFGPEFAQIPIITTNDGTGILLEDIATVKDGFEETTVSSSYNGKQAVMLDVYRVGDQTPISVSDAVRRVVEEVNVALPQGLCVDLRNDRSDIYRQRLGLLTKNGFIGLALVFILLALFLEPRLAFWVSLGIPVSFLGSLFLLNISDVSINMISMFAFIVTLGIVVDDAIIVGENIYYHQQQGKTWFKASVTGTREIAVPITFAVLTNMVAFVPMFFVPGVMGKVFKQMPLVVISVFAISLIECFFILPAHIGHKRPDVPSGFFGWIFRAQQSFGRAFIGFVNKRYGPFLHKTIRWRYLTMATGITIILITIGYIKSERMGFELFPKIESDYAKVTAVLPFGTAFEKAQQVEKKLIQAAQEVTSQNGDKELVEGIFSSIQDNTIEIRAYLTPPDVRPLPTADVTRRWREQVGVIPGLEYIKFESDAGGPGSGAALSVELRHQKMDLLERASSDMAEALSFYPNAKDIDDGFSPGKQQIDFKIKPEARSLGLEANEVARQVRHAFYGAEALRQQRGRNEVKVLVRFPRQERISEYSLEEMVLRTPKGTEILLRDAVYISRGRSYTDINRRNGQRIVTVTADVSPRSQAGQILNSIKAEILPELQQKYPGLAYSFEGHQADQKESMQSLSKGLLMAMIVIYAMLAVPLNSYIQPLIIMIAIPFGIVGAVIGHLIMGYSLSILSMFGVVALSGVVVNDSLVLIDFANRRRRAGMTPLEAIHASGIHRFRPIILTTLTTFGGLAPMIFETSRQARFLIPMALSLGFGVVFATLITLILVPSFYMIIED